MRNKTKSRNTFLHPSLLPKLSFTPNFSTSFHPAGRMGVVVISSYTVSAVPLLRRRNPRTLPLLQCGVPPKETRSFRNFSNMSSSQGLFFMKCSSMSPFPWGAVLLQWGLLSLQILPASCSSTGFPWSHSLLQTSPCSGVGTSRGCRWISAPPCPPGAAGAQPPLCGLHHRISGESQLWSLEQLLPLLLPCPGCLQSCSSHIHTPLLHLLLCSTCTLS